RRKSKPLRTKLVGLDRLIDRDGQVAGQSVERGGDARRGSVEQEHDLADQLFLRRQVRELLNFRDGNDAAFDDAGFELKRRNVLGDFGQRLGQGNRISVRIRDGVCAAQILQQALGGSSLPRAFGERAFYDFVLAADSLYSTAELVVVFD